MARELSGTGSVAPLASVSTEVPSGLASVTLAVFGAVCAKPIRTSAPASVAIAGASVLGSPPLHEALSIHDPPVASDQSVVFARSRCWSSRVLRNTSAEVRARLYSRKE